jgi:transposase
MRRRKPKTIRLKRSDVQTIKCLLCDGRTEQRIVRRALVLVAMQKSKTVVKDLCHQIGMSRFGIWSLCRRYEMNGLSVIYDAQRSGRPREISALQRVGIEQLACCNPAGLDLEMTLWSTRSLAASAIDIVDRIDDLPLFPFRRSTHVVIRKEFRNQLPFGILEVSRVGLVAFGRSPSLLDYL